MDHEQTTPASVVPSIMDPVSVEKHAQALLDVFTEKMKSELFGRFYDEVQLYLYEHHLNFENHIVDEVFQMICGSEWTRFRNKYDAHKMRMKILEEHRDEIISQIPADLVKENDELKKDVARLKELLARRSY